MESIPAQKSIHSKTIVTIRKRVKATNYAIRKTKTGTPDRSKLVEIFSKYLVRPMCFVVTSSLYKTFRMQQIFQVTMSSTMQPIAKGAYGGFLGDKQKNVTENLECN